MVTLDETKEVFRDNMVKKLNLDFFKNLFRILDKNKQVIDNLITMTTYWSCVLSQ